MTDKTKIRYRDEYESVDAEIKREIDGKIGAGSASEIFDLCRYARERTNLSKPDDDLTDSQLAWKKYFNFFHDALMKNLPSDQQTSMTQMFDLYYAQDIIGEEVELLRAVETLFFQQELLFQNYEDKSHPENLYQTRLEAGIKTMLAKTNPTEALASAHELMKMVELMKGSLVGGMKRLQQELHERLDELVTAHEKSRALVNATQDAPTEEASETDKWIDLSQGLLKASISRTDLLVKEFKIDAMFAENVVSKNGIDPNQMSEEDKKKMTETMVETNTFKMAVFQQVQDITKQRDSLSLEVFGGQEAYDVLAMEAAKTVSKWL